MLESLRSVRGVAFSVLALIAAGPLTACGGHHPAGGASAAGGDEGGKDDTFDEDVQKIKDNVPKWDNGTGVAVRFVKESTGHKLSLIYVDETPPEHKTSPAGWLIESHAKSNGKVISTITFLLSSLEPGNYRGDDKSLDAVMGVALGTDHWAPKDPDTAWSLNDGGNVKVQLHAIGGTDHVEGTFTAKLVANAGGDYYRIDEGYFYINR
jgi:hypothetical protein